MLLALLLLSFPTMAQQPASVRSLMSSYGFEDTIARLKTALTTHGLTVFADIDQRAAAAHAGLELRPTRLLLFGNPASGTPIMQANPHAALELPLRVVVWEDNQQLVHLDYQDAVQVLTTYYSVTPELTARLAAVPALLQTALANK